MKSLGIAVFSLVFGVVGALWWHSSRDRSNLQEPGIAEPAPPPERSEASIRDELITAVTIMEARIAELERELARERREEQEPSDPQPEGEAAEVEMAEGSTEGDEGAQDELVNTPFPLDFETPLDPYGEWWDTPDYGRVWQPDIGAAGGDWAPYTDGSWEYTDAGWGFVSEEPWGWATYHYGRWANFDPLGWCWVPGYEWAPSWVSWRVGSGHIGWAPLPPSARCGRGARIGCWVDTLCDIGPSLYCFVPVHQFGRGNCVPCIVDCAHDIELFLGSRNVTNIHHRGGRFAICCFGPDIEWIAHEGGRRFHRLELAAGLGHGGRGSWVDGTGRRMNVRLASPAKGSDGTKSRVARTAGKLQHDRGWDGIEGGDVESKVRRHLLAEAKGMVPQVSAMPRSKVAPQAPLNDEGFAEVAQIAAAKQPEPAKSSVHDAQREIAEAAERRKLELAAAVERANQQRIDSIKQLERQRQVADARRNGVPVPPTPVAKPQVVGNPPPAAPVLNVNPPRQVAVNNAPKVDHRAEQIRKQQQAAQQRAFAQQQQLERDQAARRAQQQMAAQREAEARRQGQIAAQRAEDARRQKMAADAARRQQIAAQQRAEAARQQKAAADAAQRRAAEAQRQAAQRQAAAARQVKPTPRPSPAKVTPQRQPVAPQRVVIPGKR